MMKPTKTDLQKKLKGDFRAFLFHVWRHLKLPEPTKRQYEMSIFLQGGPKRFILEGFRGIGKSWVTSAFVCWLLLRNLEEKILVVSASKQRADDFSTFTLQLIREIEVLKHLYPMNDQRMSKVAFDVAGCRPAHAPSVKSAGIFGQLSGSRATYIIADDIEVPNNSATQDMRQKLVKAVLEFEAILVPEGNPKIGFLGTPQTEESVYNVMRSKGYHTCIWPSEFPSEKTMEGYNGALAPTLQKELEANPKLVGKPTDPQRFTEENLDGRKAVYGKSGYALQFMLDTSLSDAERYPLKTGDCIIFDVQAAEAPSTIAYGSGPTQQIDDLQYIGFTGDKWYRPMAYSESFRPYQGAVLAIDPSGRGGDETGYAVVKQLAGNLYVPEAGGVNGGYSPEALSNLAEIAKRNNVNQIIIESNFGDGMFTELFKPVLKKLHVCGCEEVSHHIQKEKRIIDTLEPLLNQHRIVFDVSVILKDLRQAEINPYFSLFYQMTRITSDRRALRHDDRLDALSMAVAYWVKVMAQDETDALTAYKTSLLKKELETFMSGILAPVEGGRLKDTPLTGTILNGNDLGSLGDRRL